MRRKQIVYLLATLLTILFSSVLAKAQSTDSIAGNGQLDIKPLAIGDTVPKAFYSIVLNSLNSNGSTMSASLENLREKRLLIIDFFGSTCAPCIAWLKKMDTVAVDSRALVIPVTSESDEKTQKFLSRHKLQTFAVYEDSTLRRYFPHIFLPHQVWILDGKVAAISNGSKTDAQSIKEALEGAAINFEDKVDIDVDLSNHLASNPLIGFDDKVISALSVTGMIKGVNGRGYLQAKNRSLLYHFNGTITSIVQNLSKVPFNQISISQEAEDRLGKTHRLDRYCLQLIQKGNYSQDSLENLALSQFASSVGIIISEEIRHIPVYVLGSIVSQGKQLDTDTIPVTVLTQELNSYSSWLPDRPIYICDHPNITLNNKIVDRVKIRQLRSDPLTLGKELEKLELKISRELRAIRFLKIEERKKSL